MISASPLGALDPWAATAPRPTLLPAGGGAPAEALSGAAEKLRSRLAELAESVRELEAGPVTKEHGDLLRQIVGRLKVCVEQAEPLDYGDNPDVWRRAVREHFPDLAAVLDKAAEADAAFAKLKERLRTDATAAGMQMGPWTSDAFLPFLATTIQGRALHGVLGAPYRFDWHELGPGTVYIGDPVYGNDQVLQDCDLADVPARKEEFEAFFRSAEPWPEAWLSAARGMSALRRRRRQSRCWPRPRTATRFGPDASCAGVDKQANRQACAERALRRGDEQRHRALRCLPGGMTSGTGSWRSARRGWPRPAIAPPGHAPAAG